MVVDFDFGERFDVVGVFGFVVEVVCDDGGVEDFDDVYGRGRGSVVVVVEEWVVDVVLGDGVGEVGRGSEVCEVFEYCGGEN